jgi:hypothetical protein
MNDDEKDLVNGAVESSVKEMIAGLCEEYKKMLEGSGKIDEQKIKGMVNSFAYGIMAGINLANQLDFKVEVNRK